MNLEKRYKTYLILALAFCAVGIVLNITAKNTAGLGALFISSGGISLVMGITIKRKSQENKKAPNQESSFPK